MQAAYAAITPAQRDALQAAAARIRSYHERQLEACGRSWSYRDADGTLLGQKVTPLDRVGIYVPGGKAAYPSSVLMNAVPAQVAGVGEIVMVVPTPGGERNALVLAAAHVAGVQRAFTIGGAQAVAALAYGTATIPRVDKITGPGNAYVASAKRRVFGEVGIDMIAGPSEILVIADGSTPADWVAMDLFSQAEHDELAQSLLLCPDAGYLDAVRAADRAPVAHAAATRNHSGLPRGPRRADPDAVDGRGLRTEQPHRARAPRSLERRSRSAGSRCSSTPARSSSALSPARAWATIAPARTMCCRRPAPPGSPRRSASTTSRSEAASSKSAKRAQTSWGRSRPNWRLARACRPTPGPRKCDSNGPMRSLRPMSSGAVPVRADGIKR